MEKACPILEKGSHPEQSQDTRLRLTHQIKAGVRLRNGDDERQRKKRIDAFQLKGLRQILKLKTTFIDRRNTNERVFELANKAINEGTKHNNKKRKINSFFKYLEENTTGLFGHVLRAPDTDPIRDICFLQNSATPNISGDKRRGRPKLNWVITQMYQVWGKVKTEFGLLEALKLNISCKAHQDYIRAAADLHVF